MTVIIALISQSFPHKGANTQFPLKQASLRATNQRIVEYT